jgi:hypothetical protein
MSGKFGLDKMMRGQVGVLRGKSFRKEAGLKRTGRESERYRRKQRGGSLIGYDGKDFTRNGEKVSRDSLRMG